MPTISVTETAHWRDRIAARLERKIEALTAASPSLMDRVKREARQRAIQSLGLAALQTDLDTVVNERATFDRREQQAQRAMLAQVRGVAVGDIEDNHCGFHEQREIQNAINRRAAVHEEELLAEDATGRAVLRLQHEKENLLDTVWIATSPAQIKQLWCKVNELLGAEPTHLERTALAIDPVTEKG
jgi:hypothetical protein